MYLLMFHVVKNLTSNGSFIFDQVQSKINAIKLSKNMFVKKINKKTIFFRAIQLLRIINILQIYIELLCKKNIGET